MMYRKAEVFGDHAAADRVLSVGDPRQAKAIGRQVQNFDAGNWDEFRWEIVVAGNVAKFSQNQGLGEFLLRTGDAILVEASPVDAIWGIGMDKASAMNTHPRDWRGENLLGFALMETRDRLRTHAA